jgi:hypothetical protein
MGFKLSDESKEKLSELGIPDRMWGGIIRYYENGIPPGHFLSAVINNDLKEACWLADDENQHLLFNYVRWFYNYAPASSWGYPTAVKEWLNKVQMERDIEEND